MERAFNTTAPLFDRISKMLLLADPFPENHKRAETENSGKPYAPEQGDQGSFYIQGHTQKCAAHGLDHRGHRLIPGKSRQRSRHGIQRHKSGA